MKNGMFKDNVVCSLLNIDYPIFQGGMAWVADAELAAAVSNAGGLGIIAAMNSNKQQLKAEIAKARKLTDRPFGVNIMLMSPYAEEVAEAVIEEKIPVVTTGAGNPSKFIPKWLDSGIKVIPVVPSAAYAKLVERAGASAVIAEGGEAGGHIGDVTTMVLTPRVKDSVKIPVIAAGGIADGRGAAAAFMLGADGIQVGTRFLCADECSIHNEFKQRVLKASETDTVVTGRRLGHPVRSLKSTFSREFLKLEYDSAVTNEQLEAMGAGSLRLAVKEGDPAKGSFMAGQSAGLVNRLQPAAEIITGIFAEMAQIINKSSNYLK